MLNFLTLYFMAFISFLPVFSRSLIYFCTSLIKTFVSLLLSNDEKRNITLSTNSFIASSISFNYSSISPYSSSNPSFSSSLFSFYSLIFPSRLFNSSSNFYFCFVVNLFVILNFLAWGLTCSLWLWLYVLCLRNLSFYLSVSFSAFC